MIQWCIYFVPTSVVCWSGVGLPLDRCLSVGQESTYDLTTVCLLVRSRPTTWPLFVCWSGVDLQLALGQESACHLNSVCLMVRSRPATSPLFTCWSGVGLPLDRCLSVGQESAYHLTDVCLLVRSRPTTWPLFVCWSGVGLPWDDPGGWPDHEQPRDVLHPQDWGTWVSQRTAAREDTAAREQPGQVQVHL